MREYLFLIFISLLAACTPPGKGRNFDRAKEKAEIVVDAIEGYRRIENRYPRNLESLVPRYLDKKFIEKYRPGQSLSFSYSSSDDYSYVLMFEYSGPGLNLCVHESSSGAGEWECRGHY